MSTTSSFDCVDSFSSAMAITPFQSRHDDDVAAAQEHVLLEEPPAQDGFEIERQPLLLTVVAAQHENLAGARERRRPACEAQRLDDVDTWIHDELAGPNDLPDDIDFVAAYLENGDRHDRVGNDAAQRFHELSAQLLDGLADCIDFADDGERERAVGSHDDLLSELGVSPDRDLQPVGGLDLV